MCVSRVFQEQRHRSPQLRAGENGRDPLNPVGMGDRLAGDLTGAGDPSRLAEAENGFARRPHR